jgi:hypothetical protein
MLATVLGLIMFALWAFEKHLWKHYTSLETFWSTVMVDSHTSMLKFHCFYTVNMCQTDSIIEVFWIPLYTGTPYIFCLPTTVSMCLCQGIGTEESQKSTFIHKDSTFHCFHVVNMCPTGSIIEVFWIPLYTGTPYIFCLPTTTIACVFVKE